MKLPSRPRTWLILILTVSVGLRLGYLLAFGNTLTLQASGYDAYAVHLANGQGYTRFDNLQPDSELPPLYAYFLAGIYRIAGRNAFSAAVVQIGLDVVTILAVYGIGRRAIGPENGVRVGLIAALLTGCYPYLIFQDLSINDTAIFVCLLAVGVWMFYRTLDALPDQKARWAILAGLVLGLAALTKFVVVLLVPLIALWWWRQIGLKRAIWLTLLLGGALMLTITPWIIRNTRLNGMLTLVSTNDGSNLYQGNNSCTIDYLQAGYDVQWIGNCMNMAPPTYTAAQSSVWMRDQAITYLFQHVSEWPHLFGLKFLVLWSPEITPRAVPPDAPLTDNAVLQYQGTAFQLARVVHLVYFAPLLLLGVIGLWLGWRERRLIGPCVAVLLSITAAYLIYHPSTRYRVPADPFLFILAAYSIVIIGRRILSRNEDHPTPVGGSTSTPSRSA